MEKRLCFGCMEYMESESESCQCGFKEAEYESEPHHLKPGTMLKERYQVGKVMGEGGFGITYVGRDMVLDLKVAIKEFYMSGYVNRNNTYSTLVRASVGSHTELFERNREKFLTEARVLAKFANEEGIVGIRDFFQENNTAYIVMDFLTGETLRDYLKMNTKLPWDKTLQIMKPVIKSLGTVHNHNVIHRDISPDNIMLTKDGKVKLLDFGAAREVSQTDIKSLSVILKPGYAPEEQYRSKGQQGPWTDIYALCATIYCCIAGTVPEDSMERMFEDKLKPLHEIEPGCSVAVSNVISRGMAVRQKDRYQSIAELQADLDKALANPEDANIAGGQAVASVAKGAVQETVQRAVQAADDNATVYAGEIKETAQTIDDNATVYAGEIKATAQETAQTIDNNATVYAGEIKETVKSMPTAEAAPKKAEAKAETPKPEKKAEEKPAAKAEKAAAKKAEAPKAASQPKAAGKEKKPMSNNKKVAIIIAIFVVVGLIKLISGIMELSNVSSGDSGGSFISNISTSSKDNSVPVPAALSNYEITLNGTVITLPATYQDFVDAGWEAEDPAAFAAKEISPNTESYNTEYLINVTEGFGKISVCFTNPSSSVKSLADCWIYNVYVNKYSLEEGSYSGVKPHEVAVKDMVVGKTTEDELKQAYGEYQKELSSYYYGSDKMEGKYQFGFAEGILNSARITCYKEPKDFVDNYADKAPEFDEVAFREKTDTLCEVVMVRGDGTTYSLRSGVKVQQYADLGWTLLSETEFLPANGYEDVKIKADARTQYSVAIVNPYKEATAIKECMIYNMKFYTDNTLSDDTWTLVFNDGTVFDSTVSQDQLKEYCDSKGIEYTSLNGSMEILPGGESDQRGVTIIWTSTGTVNSINFSSGITPMKEFFAGN